jgi:hypothetical protein
MEATRSKSAAGDLAEEHAGLRAGVEEGDGLVGPEIRAAVVRGPRLGQRVEHPVGEFGRGEDLVVGEIGDAGEYVRIPPAQGEGNLNGLWRGGHELVLLMDSEWRAFSKAQNPIFQGFRWCP